MAILLALLLGLFTWLYTYKQDARKFWLGLGLAILSLFVFLTALGFVLGDAAAPGAQAHLNANWLLPMMVSFMVVSVLWIWSLLDVLRKNNDWYAQYPNCL